MTDPSSLHPARHLSMTVLSRSDGRSAVASAAYILRERMEDVRLGRAHDYRRRRDVLASGQVGWWAAPEGLWQAAEAAETRRNARTARELRIALPSELPLDAQARLITGYVCNLRDRYGIAATWAIHGPRFRDGCEGRRLEQERTTPEGAADYAIATRDREQSNLNFHVHILMTTREVDAGTGAFGVKTRILDDRKTGPKQMLLLRQDWEKRANAELIKINSNARIDLRSYAQMAADGDAPDGMEAQPHLGPLASTNARVAATDATLRIPMAAIERDEARIRNDQLLTSWLTLRALRRERARLADQGISEARRRELARCAADKDDRRRIADARTAEERAAAIEAARSIDAPFAARTPSPPHEQGERLQATECGPTSARDDNPGQRPPAAPLDRGANDRAPSGLRTEMVACKEANVDLEALTEFDIEIDLEIDLESDSTSPSRPTPKLRRLKPVHQRGPRQRRRGE